MSKTKYKKGDIYTLIVCAQKGDMKALEELIADYDKVKSVPENLSDISLVDNISIDINAIDQIINDLIKAYTLSSFSDEFKAKIKSKQDFIEEGLKLFQNSPTAYSSGR